MAPVALAPVALVATVALVAPVAPVSGSSKWLTPDPNDVFCFHKFVKIYIYLKRKRLGAARIYFQREKKKKVFVTYRTFLFFFVG